MPAAEMDLRTLLDQDRRMVLDLLDQSAKLVLEVSASHYWTVYYIQVFGQLNNITANLERLIAACQSQFGEGAQVFARPDSLRLWKSASGLWRAVPPELTKLTEQMARRRRQRIKGEKIEELADVTPEMISQDLERFRNAHGQLSQSVERLVLSIEAVPEGLRPTQDMLAAAATAAAVPAWPPVPPTAPGSTGQPAALPSEPKAAPPVQLSSTPGPALTLPPAPGAAAVPPVQPKPVADPDELSPT